MCERIRVFWSRFDDLHVNDEVREFVELFVVGVRDQDDAIDVMIQKVSINWKLERMVVVDRNILWIVIYELRYLFDILSKVSMNEVIEIVKCYGTGDSSLFINGILDKIFGMS